MRKKNQYSLLSIFIILTLLSSLLTSANAENSYDYLFLGTAVDGEVREKLNEIQDTEGYRHGQYRNDECIKFASKVFTKIFGGTPGILYLGHTPASNRYNYLVGRLFDLDGWDAARKLFSYADEYGLDNSDSDKQNTKLRTNYGAITKNSVRDLLSNAYPGDVVSTINKSNKVHTFIVNGVDTSGLSIYEGNFGGVYKINICTRTWQEMATAYNRSITLYRAKNYDEINLVNSSVLLLDANGGELEAVSRRIIKDKAYGKLPVPSRDHYTFLGWYTEKNGGTAVYEDTIVQTDGDQTLYAHWEGNPVNVSLKNEGEVIKTITPHYGETYGKIPVPSREGYSFLGWYNAEADGERVLESTIVAFPEDHTLYARWEQIESGGTYDNLLKGIKYTVKTDGTLKITYCNIVTFAGDVVLPDKINGKTVTELGSGAINSCSNLTSLVMPDTYTTLGTGAIASNVRLESVRLSENLKSIPISCFKNCGALKYVNLPEKITSIGSQAFDKCYSLTNVYVPDSVVTIDSSAFSNCTSLERVRLPDTLKKISAGAYSNCENLYHINIPENISSLGADIFSGCLKLKAAGPARSAESYNIVYPWTERIPSNVFKDIQSLETVMLPGTLTSIGNSSFQGCTSLKAVSIPSSVETVGSSLFKGCTALQHVKIYGQPTGAAYIFSGCKALTTAGPLGSDSDIEFNWQTEIPTQAFASSCIETILLPNRLERIQEETFKDSKLRTITIPETVKSIDNYAFHHCDALTSVKLSEGIETLGYQVFAECSSLENIVIPESVNTMGSEIFMNCKALKTAHIPDSVTIIPNSLFYGCSSLITAYLPDAIVRMGFEVFSDCTSLEYIRIPEGALILSAGLFRNCSKLDLVIIPGSVTSIDDGTFENCTGIQKVYYVSDKDAWDRISKGTNTGLEGKEIVFCCTYERGAVSEPNYYGSCGDGLSWTVSDTGLLSISGSGTISDCSDTSHAEWQTAADSISSLEIGPNVTAIGAFSFANLTNLKEVYFKGNAPEISDSAFTNVEAVVYYPAEDGTWDSVKDNDYGGSLSWSVPLPTGAFLLTERYIPDPVFRAYLSSTYDYDHDGYLSKQEIAAIDQLVCDDMEISSFKGIEFLSALTSFSCRNNAVAEIDISRNEKLTLLDCSNNQLRELDVSKNKKLTSLLCSGNPISNLDVVKNDALVSLECSETGISELNVQKNSSLETLICANNNLEELNTSHNSALKTLCCSGNKLNLLDISNNSLLSTLECERNQIRALDISFNELLGHTVAPNNTALEDADRVKWQSAGSTVVADSSMVIYRIDDSIPSVCYPPDNILTIPESVSVIDDEAFLGLPAVAVYVPPNVDYIGYHALGNMMIFGSPMSEAQFYAEDNGLLFVPII